MKSQEVIRALGALAQETRLAAYRLLVRAGPEGRRAGGIARELDVPAPTMSFHLKELTQAGLVSAKRQGRAILYAPDFDRMGRIVGYLMENCCEGRCP